MNPKRSITGLILPFTQMWTNPKWKLPGLVMSPEIINVESKMKTLNPKTFESRTFNRATDFFSNPDIISRLLWSLLAISSCLILLKVQAINFIMCTAVFLRERKLSSQGSLPSATLNRRPSRWQDQRPRRFWVRPGRTSAWWDNMMENVTVASEWKENFKMSHPTFSAAFSLCWTTKQHCAW